MLDTQYELVLYAFAFACGICCGFTLGSIATFKAVRWAFKTKEAEVRAEG